MDLTPSQRKAYDKMIANGQSHNMALMLASRVAPSVKGGDTMFNKTARSRMNEMTPFVREAMVKRAKKAGVQTNGKYYVPALGRWDDQAAWCSGTDDVTAVAKKKGLKIEGMAGNVDYSRPAPPRKQEGKKLAADIRDRIVSEKLRADPSLAEKVRKSPSQLHEVRQQVTEQHGMKSSS